jgi:hypothetical protein
VAAGTTHGYVAKGGMGITILGLLDAQPTDTYLSNGVAYGVTIDQNVLYVACGTAGLAILNVSNPADLTLITNYDLPGVIVDVAKVGDRLCVADALSGVSIIDVSNPAMPALYANATTNSPAFHISSAGSRILAADKQGGLAVLGVTPWPMDLLGELSGDNRVDLDDLTILAGQWLHNETDLDVLASNLDYYDTLVNLRDLSVLASGWLSVDLISNLEGYWEFNETSGSFASDTSPNSRNGVLMNMSDSSWVAGKTGNALSFDGTNDYVVIPDYTGIGGTGSRTVSLWIKTTINRVQELVQWGSDATSQLWLTRIQANGTVLVAVYGGGVYSTATVTDGQWHHIAAVLDAGQTSSSQIRLYIDGLLDTTALTVSCTINTAQTTPVHLGVWHQYSNGNKINYFQGQMDQVRINNRAVTALEIAEMAQ